MTEISVRVGFVGPAKSGKSFAARFVAEATQGVTASFAEPLKREIYDFLREYRMNGHLPIWKAEHREQVMEGPNLGIISLPPLPTPQDPQFALTWIDKHKDELRPLLQWWGTDFRRSKDDQYWIKKMKKILDDYEIVTVDDCRFVNEAKFLYENDFVLIGIEPEFTAKNVNFEHPSEKGVAEIIKSFHLPVVKNDGMNAAKFRQDIIDILDEEYQLNIWNK